MYKIYGPAASRVFRCIWTLCETESEFEHIHLSFRNGEVRSPEFLKMNPMGKVPVLEYDGKFLFESGAICSFVAQKERSNVDLIGDEGSWSRAEVNKWLYFTMSELEQPLWNIRKHTQIYPSEIRCEKIIESANIDFLRAINTLKSLLSDEFLVRNKFSLADIFVAQTLFWAKQVDELEADMDEFKDYLNRLKERSKFPSIKEYLPN